MCVWRVNGRRRVSDKCRTRYGELGDFTPLRSCHQAELRNLVSKKPNFVLYDGFEPSGRMHIAQGVFKAMNVNRCTAAGGTFIFWVADWFVYVACIDL